MMSRAAAFGPAIGAIALLVAGTVISATGTSAGGPTLQGALSLVGVLATAVVGLVLGARRPGNPIGPLFGWLALADAANLAASAYAIRAFSGEASLPGAEWAAWFGNWSDRSATAFMLALFLLFPTGRLVSPRWRPALLLPPIVALGFATRAFVPGPMDLLGVPNPVGLAWVPLDVDEGNLGGLPLLAGSILAFAALVVRYRAAGAVEREQIKWLALPVLALSVALVFSGVTIGLGIDRTPAVDEVGSALYSIVGVLLPVGMGIAVLRYRLYDIDVLINRTIVYAALTAALAAVYAGAVIAMQTLLGPLTRGNEIAVAGSTLLVVALFQPLRRRIQGAVDRRFYRAKYDAERTLDTFAARLRDEVDLDAVRADLVNAVQRSVQPTHASVWLREQRS